MPLEQSRNRSNDLEAFPLPALRIFLLFCPRRQNATS
jgi:hypothetical protein